MSCTRATPCEIRTAAHLRQGPSKLQRGRSDRPAADHGTTVSRRRALSDNPWMLLPPAFRRRSSSTTEPLLHRDVTTRCAARSGCGAARRSPEGCRSSQPAGNEWRMMPVLSIVYNQLLCWKLKILSVLAHDEHMEPDTQQGARTANLSAHAPAAGGSRVRRPDVMRALAAAPGSPAFRPVES